LIFPDSHDIEFIEDVFARLGERKAIEMHKTMWTKRLAKPDVIGIHGTLFYQLRLKKK